MSIPWYNNYSVLYTNPQFIPNNSMNETEKLNAITRLCLLISLILLFVGFSIGWVILPLIIILIYNLYYLNTHHESFTQNADMVYEGRPEYELESGYYDSDNNLFLGTEYTVNTKRDKELTSTLDDLVKYQNQVCKKPTPDNPFMNPIITEYNTEDPPVACNADDEDIKVQIQKNFNKNLYMSVDNLFNLKNSQRQFYTIPMPGIPPDQPAFANWCYRTQMTCKENQQNCLKYEDLRFKSLRP